MPKAVSTYHHGVTVIGSLNVDLVSITPRIPVGGETLTSSSFSTGAGGKGGNQAVAAARTSRKKGSKVENGDVLVKFIGAVGGDAFGENLRKGMESDGIDVSGVKVVEGQNTGVAVIIVEQGTGENRILVNPGANGTVTPDLFQNVENLGTEKPDLVVLQLEIPLETTLAVVKLCQEHDIPVLLNPAPAVPLPEWVYKGLENLIVNETEAAILSGRSLEEVNAPDFNWKSITDHFLALGVRNVVITLGGKGVFAADSYIHSYGSHYAPKKVKVVDTTCAGDTFVGAYASLYVKGQSDEGPEAGWDLSEVVRKCMRASEITVQRAGAQVAIPWGDEVGWDSADSE